MGGYTRPAVSVSKKGYRLVKMYKNNFVKFLHYACFFDRHDKGRKNWTALRPRRPFLFRSAGKGSKRGRFARHFGSGKMKPREKPFGGTHKNSPPHGAQTICAPVFSPRETR